MIRAAHRVASAGGRHDHVGSSWAEWRDEHEQATLDAAAARRHGLDVRARLREAMARGDRVWIACGGVRVVGVVIEVDRDLVSLRGAPGRVDVRLEPVPMLAMGLIEVAAGPGCTPPLPSGGFRGRLLAAEMSAADYVVELRDTEALVGRVLAGADHIDVVAPDGTSTTITLPMVVALRVSDSGV